ncbi:helix-hairpin-helix domain-containing protein [Solemya velum gill symbiont]|uniref:DNA-binding protein n=2 Tax=Solemya velum gill symbiont TaxID=2340 RepID=A0A0B0HEJ5_SOVGS|nr:helix-hairpin-helix domain-containing protein [Solemya velum gill symbiont]KHF25846.1 helix-hairpin-helix DNA-binding protein [Solemya velum gill symbiont]OOY34547.1 DNA-binding protein [Solemya velum gill symbiont]OOY37262.1 DNA-binding protein [Solemya velum gill symbiont]OOY40493.1 DNA-binding protein [Solemya velum gill symbiont]OOY47581.1 DNA-binding protein [Solemya velum gill symbiont]
MLDNSINHDVATKLREVADILEQQGANPFRIRAYRRAAETVTHLEADLPDLLEQGGIDALIELPNIGRGIATAIAEILATGRWAQLERLRGSLDPVKRLQSVAGIGPKLAQRIHDELHIDTLEGLELAAHDGRLEELEGVGVRRATSISATVENMLDRVRSSRHNQDENGPSVEMLLDVDREYREKSSAGELPTIAPRRFNPNGEAWLPILHTERNDWHFTALFSNTARAHELGHTHDWVVIYHYNDHQEEGQHTVVTETHGAMIGQRVVRGLEIECRALWENNN